MIDEFLSDCPFADTVQVSGAELPESLQSAAYKAERAAVALSRAVLESAGRLAKGQGTDDDDDEQDEANRAFLVSPHTSVAASERGPGRAIGEKVSAEEAFGTSE